MSGTAQTFTAIISAQDQISQALNAINARLKEVVTTENQATQAGGNLARSNDLARRGFTALHDTLSPIAARIRGITTSILGVVAAAAGIGGLGFGAGLLALARNSGEVASQIEALHGTLGVSRQQLHLLSYSAVQGGTSLEAMTDPLTRLRDTMAQVARGAAPEARNVLRELGIAVRNTDGTLRPLTTLVGDVGRAFEANTDPAQRARIALALLGTTNEQVMATFGRLRRSATAFREAGGGLTDREYEQLLEYRAAWQALAGQFERIRDLAGALAQRFAAIVGAGIAPALTQIAERLTAFIDANRELVSTRVAEWANNLSAALMGVDWVGVGQSIDGVVGGLRAVLSAAGGVEGVVTGLGVVIAAAFAAPVLGSIAAIVTILGGPLTVAMAGIVAAGVAIYRNWEDVRSLGLAAFGAIGRVVERLGQIFTEHLLGPLRTARDFIQGLLDMVPRLGALQPRTPEERRQSLGRNGAERIPGYDDGAAPAPALPTVPPAIAALPRLPTNVAQLPQLRGGTAGQAPNGEVNVRIQLEGAPPGTTASATARGQGLPPPQLDIGQAFGPRVVR